MGGGRYGTRRSSSFLVHYLPAGSRHCLRSLGCWPLTSRPSGLDAVQGALRPLYLAWIRGGRRPQPCVLAVRPDGLSVRYDEGGSKDADNVFHPFRTIAMWAAVRCQVRVNSKAGGLEWAFVPLDTSLPSAVARRCFVPLPDDDLCRHLAVTDHPPMFLCVMRQRGVAHSLACHVFACVRTEQAAALATGLYHALTASMKSPTTANQPSALHNFHNGNSFTEPQHANQVSTSTASTSSTKSKRTSYSSKTSTLSAEISFKQYFPFANISWKSSSNEPKSSKWSNYFSFLPSFKSKNVQRSRSFSQLLLDTRKSKKNSNAPSRPNHQHRTAPVSRGINNRISEEEAPVHGPGVFFRTPLPRSASFLQLQARNKDLLSDASLEVRIINNNNTAATFHKPEMAEYSDCTSGCYSLPCPYEIGDFILAQKGCSTYTSLKNNQRNDCCECCDSDKESHNYEEIDYSTTIASKQQSSMSLNETDNSPLYHEPIPNTQNRPSDTHDSVLSNQSECSSMSEKAQLGVMLSEDSDSANDADVESLAENEDKKCAVDDEPLQLLATANIEEGHMMYSGNNLTVDISGLKKSAELSAIFQQLSCENEAMCNASPEVILSTTCSHSNKATKRKRKDEAINPKGSPLERNVWQMEGAIYYP